MGVLRQVYNCQTFPHRAGHVRCPEQGERRLLRRCRSPRSSAALLDAAHGRHCAVRALVFTRKLRMTTWFRRDRLLPVLPPTLRILTSSQSTVDSLHAARPLLGRQMPREERQYDLVDTLDDPADMMPDRLPSRARCPASSARRGSRCRHRATRPCRRHRRRSPRSS